MNLNSRLRIFNQGNQVLPLVVLALDLSKQSDDRVLFWATVVAALRVEMLA